MDWRDFALADPDAVERLLGSFAPEVREKGEETFRRGVVQSIRCLDAHREFAATIPSPKPVEIGFRIDGEVPGATARVECNCPAGPACEHAYALARHLLTRHHLVGGSPPKPAARRAAVKSTAKTAPAPRPVAAADAGDSTPSRATAPDSPSVANPSGNPSAPKSEPGPVERRLIAAGHETTEEERRFLGKIGDLYRRFGRRPSIPRPELERLGIAKPSAGGSSFDGVQLWRSLPEDEHEFWLYLAQYAEEKGTGIPGFLRPVSPLEPLRQKLAIERRRHEIGHWRQLLGQWGTAAEVESAENAPTDLRARFTENEVVLEWRRGTSDEHEPIKAHQFERFAQTHLERGLVDTAATLIWQCFQQGLSVTGYRKPALSPTEPTARRVIGFLLRQPTLVTRLVNAEGEPLARPAEPLRWQLEDPDQPQGDYILRLVQADGTAVPEIRATFPGEPTLYLTADAVFEGPSVDDRVLAINRPTPIPAAAIESHGGVRFLRNLGAPLPGLLADRVQLIPLHPVFRLELRKLTHGSEIEHCVLDALGASDDGEMVERWNGLQWQVPSRPDAPAPAAPIAPDAPLDPNERIVSVDRGPLAGLADVVDAGGFRWDYARLQWSLRVTRGFPEKFVPWLKSIPPTVRVELRGELASFLNAEVAGRVRLSVEPSEAIDWFDLRVVLDVDDTTLNKDELKALLEARGRWVRLAGKGWRRLNFQLTKEEDEQLARLGLSPHELSAEPQRMHVLQLADDAARGMLPEDAVLRIRARAGELKARVTPALPSTVHAELRPYQLEGFHFLAYLSTNGFGGVLADDMGLGKTLQTLTWLQWVRSETAAGKLGTLSVGSSVPVLTTGRSRKKAADASDSLVPPSLVVCPKSVADNWRAESARFTPSLKVRVWGSNEIERLPKELDTAELHILNYNQLRAVGEALANRPLLCVILDEGQYIKNPASVTAMIARTLKARHRLLLSGTPIENRLLDLWSLMAFAMPGVLGSRAGFQKLFDTKDDPFARRRLTARVRPFLLRRTKSQVARDLPDRIEEDLYCELEGEQLVLYRAELKRAQQVLLRVGTPKQLNQERFNLLTSLLRLRQICCHPRLVQPASTQPGAKLEALLEQLEPLMEEGQKVLVFSQFVSLLDLLRDELRTRGWPVFFLAGETEDRGALVRDFQSAEGNAVFLISLKAGGFGLNLTAASYVVLFDPWWNPAVEAQAIDRTHRIGQTQKVIAYRLLIKNSLEEKIRSLQHQKRALANEVLGEENFTNQLSLEDFQFLLAD